MGKIDRDRAKELIESGFSIRAVAMMFNATPAAISYAVGGVRNLRQTLSGQTSRSGITDDEVMRRLEAGETRAEIAKSVGIKSDMIELRARRAGGWISDRSIKSRRIDERVKELRDKGMVVADIAFELNVETATVYNSLRRIDR